jgi:hypothetical protein
VGIENYKLESWKMGKQIAAWARGALLDIYEYEIDAKGAFDSALVQPLSQAETNCELRNPSTCW